MKSKPQDIVQLLGQRFHRFQDSSTILAKLDHILPKLLPEEMHPHVFAGSLTSGVLILHLSSATWMTQLQYRKLSLLSELRRNGFPMLTTIEFKVNPQVNKLARTVQKNENQLTAASAEHILNAANSIGGELGDKLKKLAQKAKKQK